jgi:hypothetical protein
VLVLSALSAISPEPVAPVPAPRAAVVVPPSKLHALAVAPVTPSAAIAGLSRATATREERPAEPMEAAESPAQRGADDPLPGPTSAPAASGVQIATAADVADDLDVLRQVHAALRGRRSEVALSLLDRAARGLEAGPLAEQAQGARVSALCQLGRLADAREATHRFLVAWPASPLAMRLRGGCDALEVNAKPNAD